jgi:hypothetical protein
MNIKARFLGAVIGLSLAFFYVTFFEKPGHDKIVKALEHADTTQVIAAMGQPDKKMNAATFNRRAEEMLRAGYPIRNGDTTARGEVWLYSDHGANKRRYTTVLFDTSNQVSRVIATYWMDAP